MNLKSKTLFPLEERKMRALWLKKAPDALEALEKQFEALYTDFKLLEKQNKKLATTVSELETAYDDISSAYNAVSAELLIYKENVNTNSNQQHDVNPTNDSEGGHSGDEE